MRGGGAPTGWRSAGPASLRCAAPPRPRRLRPRPRRPGARAGFDDAAAGEAGRPIRGLRTALIALRASGQRSGEAAARRRRRRLRHLRQSCRRSWPAPWPPCPAAPATHTHTAVSLAPRAGEAAAARRFRLARACSALRRPRISRLRFAPWMVYSWLYNYTISQLTLPAEFLHMSETAQAQQRCLPGTTTSCPDNVSLPLDTRPRESSRRLGWARPGSTCASMFSSSARMPAGWPRGQRRAGAAVRQRRTRTRAAPASCRQPSLSAVRVKDAK